MITAKSAFKAVLMFIKYSSHHGTISRKKGAADFLSARIMQAATQPDLQLFGERLAALLGTELDGGAMYFADLLRVSSSPFGSRVLAWLRRHPQTAAQMVFVSARPEEGSATSPLDALLSDLNIDDMLPQSEHGTEDHVATSAAWDIALTARLLSPLAHGSDSKSGNATLFRRMEVLGVNGGVMSLPFYSGNAVRGQMRDLLANDFLTAMGLPTASLSLWFFHLLYAGGALEEGSAATKALAKRCGDNGGVRAEGVRELRDTLPAISLLGGGIGNKIISGRVMVGDLRPQCKEWGTGDKAAALLMDWQYLTRRDDDEDRGKDDGHHGMIANTETLMAGVVLDGGINISDHASDVERSALGRGLSLLAARGFLGAENRRGFGRTEISAIGMPDECLYATYLVENRQPILEYLFAIGAITTMATEDNERQDARSKSDSEGLALSH